MTSRRVDSDRTGLPIVGRNGRMGRHWFAAALVLAISGCAEVDAIDPEGSCATETCGPAGSEGTTDVDDDGGVEGEASGGTESGAAPAGGIPCDVLDVLRANCHECHGETPKFGAPMALVDYDDLQVPALSDPTRAVYELVAERLVDETAPMPPVHAMETGDRDRLIEWVQAGAPEDPNAECGDAPPEDDPQELPCEPDLEFTAHALGSEDAFAVPTVGAENLYMCFSFKAPFDVATQATAWSPIIDDERVVHHWILYRSVVPLVDGGVTPCEGSLQLTTEFVAGWAPGGGNIVMPPDVGLDLGGPEHWYILQIHYNNGAHHADAVDRSGVAFCTADEPRSQTAGVLTLGTMAITVPPLAEDFPAVGICSGASTATWPEMHLLGGSPHMHELGRAMRTDVLRLDGTTETVLDVPQFDFNSQAMYMFDEEVVIKPGETLTTTCKYDNPNIWPVLFGERTQDEMCFDFVLAYPVESLLTRNCLL
jgi:hypothetical protein